MMKDDDLKKEGNELLEEELEQVTGGIQRPTPPPAPGSSNGI